MTFVWTPGGPSLGFIPTRLSRKGEPFPSTRTEVSHHGRGRDKKTRHFCVHGGYKSLNCEFTVIPETIIITFDCRYEKWLFPSYNVLRTTTYETPKWNSWGSGHNLEQPFKGLGYSLFPCWTLRVPLAFTLGDRTIIDWRYATRPETRSETRSMKGTE